jgi:Na+/proline symporter
VDEQARIRLFDEEPISREEADVTYAAMRRAVLVSTTMLLALGGVTAAFEFSGWPAYVGAAILISVLAVPLFMRRLRRELDQKVRAAEHR